MEAMAEGHGGHADGSRRQHPITHLHKAICRLLLFCKGRSGWCSALGEDVGSPPSTLVDQRLATFWTSSTLVVAGQLSLSFRRLWQPLSQVFKGRRTLASIKRGEAASGRGSQLFLLGEPLARIDT
jgi:hypothetical protein